MQKLGKPETVVTIGHLNVFTAAGLGETIPLLNGVSSITDEATSLNTTAANINSLVASGNHVVAQVQSKGIEVSFLSSWNKTHSSKLASMLCNCYVASSCLAFAHECLRRWHMCCITLNAPFQA